MSEELEYERIRDLVETYYDLQKLRIAVGNRLLPKCTKLYTKKKTKKGGVKRPCPYKDRKCSECEFLSTKTDPGLSKLHKLLLNEEKGLAKEFKEIAEGMPIYTDWLQYVKGVGPVLTVGLKAYIKSIERFRSVSALWKYSGLAPDQTRKVRGKKLNYNVKLKTHLWKIGRQLLMARSKYSEYYNKWKQEELKKGITKLHAHNRAMRKMIKLFLSHYWEKEREIIGLPSGKAYVIDILKHTDYIPPIYDKKP